MSYKITPVTESDLMNLFGLANDSVVRENSFNRNKITLEEHKKWFSNKLSDKNCYFYTVKRGDDFIGSVRFDLSEENNFIISIQIAEKFRGQGLAAKIIGDTTAQMTKLNKKIIAHIKCNNEPSLKVFLSANYKIVGTAKRNDSDFYILEYQTN